MPLMKVLVITCATTVPTTTTFITMTLTGRVLNQFTPMQNTGHLAEVDCLMSTQRSVVNVVQDRENGWVRLLQLEEEQRKVREEQRQHQEQLAKFLTQFQEEVQKVESLQQQRIQSNMTASQGATGGGVRRAQKSEATDLTTIFRGGSSTQG